MKYFIRSDKFKIIISLLVILQPIIELDYLFYDVLNNYGLPRLTTIIRFIIIPIFIMLGFIYNDKNKKRTIILVSIYSSLLLLYLIIHSSYVTSIFNTINLPTNFNYNIVGELIYCFILVIPFYLIYLFYISDIKDNIFKNTIIISSLVISLPIFVSNITVTGLGTYGAKPAVDNIFSWFNGAYINYIPSQLATKFYFEQGNAIGVLLFVLLPILFLYYFKSESTKERLVISIAIIIQSFAMYMMSTRVTTYGVLLTLIMVIIYSLISKVIMKNLEFNKVLYVFPIVLLIIFGGIFKYTPMYQNQLLAQENDALVKNDDYLLDRGKENVLKLLENKEIIVSDELIKAFNKYAIEDNLISAIPPVYFNEWYPYTFDSYFWLDILFNVDFYDRVNGRQVQQLFLDYKTEELGYEYNMLGHGYTTFMTGSLILEKDFVQQYYSLGIIGFILMMSIWIILLIFGVIKILLNFNKLFNFENMILGTSILFGLMGAYLSGNIMDQLITTTLFAYIIAKLLRNVSEVYYDR